MQDKPNAVKDVIPKTAIRGLLLNPEHSTFRKKGITNVYFKKTNWGGAREGRLHQLKVGQLIASNCWKIGKRDYPHNSRNSAATHTAAINYSKKHNFRFRKKESNG